LRSLNLYQLTPIAPKVPITVAVSEELKAMIMLFRKLRQSSRSAKSRLYHRKEKPVHLILIESLNEESIRMTSGRKRKIIVMKKTSWEKEKAFLTARFA